MAKVKPAPENRPFSLLVKPAAADCNLRCSYCFYLEKAGLYPSSPVHRMSDEVLEKLISSYMATRQKVYAFGWQGGEPMMMGLDFFRKVTALQEKHGPPGAVVSNGLQTNGTLLTDEAAEFFTRYRFLLGVSLDGPEDLHGVYRVDGAGESSFRRVLRGIAALRRRGTEFNILTLVSSANVGKSREVYEFLRSQGFYHHQYIPCVEWDGAGRDLPWSISGEDWGRFLLGIFQAWHPRDTATVSVRLFDSILHFLVHGSHNVCFMGGSCASYFMVEHNGDVYPCDFFARPDLLLGNVTTHSFRQLDASPVYRRFGAAKSRWSGVCGDCEFLPFCSGDCVKNRPGMDRDPRTLSPLCAGWKLFYRETLPVFRSLAEELLRLRGPDEPRLHPRAGRTREACFCGSGRLYGNCHGAAAGPLRSG